MEKVSLMETSNNCTHRPAGHSRITVDFGRLRFWKARFLASVLIAFGTAAAKSDAEGANSNDPFLAQIAMGVGELIRQTTASARGGVAPKPAGQAQDPAVQLLIDRAGDDVQVHLRPGNQTVMQLRGRVLEPRAKGAALAGLADSPERTARKLFSANRALLRLAEPDEELALVQNRRDALGHQHLRFGQEYKGLPVWPAELGAHFDRVGNLTLVEGAYVPTPALDSLEPKLSGDDAVERAKTEIAPGKSASASAPQLIIYGPVNRPPRLAWKFELTVSLSEAWLLVVDAQEGGILHRSSRVCDGQVQGSGVDLVGASRSVNVWQTDNTYYLADTSKRSYNAAFDPINDPHGVITIADAQGASVQEVLLGASRIVSGNAPDRWDVPAAISAAFNFSETYDYYLDRHGRNSLDGEGGNITAIVRVGNYNNASWNGNLRVMLFGEVEPFAASLDVIGHELTHGVTQTSAGLLYENQSGALNEAFSDILGDMVEARTRGRNDWLMGSDLKAPIRNLKDPAAFTAWLTGRPYPVKMSEFAQIPNTPDSDHGGVHINSSIINHAFYLLAEGMPGAIGLGRAESIFFRCLTQHLLAQSQFVDCRLGCVAAAEELFGKDSTEARLTAQAFDTVEILAAPNTPEPTPIPTVAGPDSILFVYHDFWSGELNLGRREVALEDDQYGTILATSVNLARPAVTGDGSLALFVNPEFDLCAVNTADPNSRQCLGFPGRVHSVAISPDAKLAAFVLRDEQTGQPEGKITLLDLAANTAAIHNLVAPSADGLSVDSVLYADSMTFTTDSSALIYDALSELKFGNGPTVQRWSIYSLRLATGQTSIIVPPQDGIDTGNPAVGRAGNRYLAYDARQAASGASSIVVLDLFTGESAEVGTVQNGFGYPSFLGDESGLIYSAPDPDAFVTGYSILKQDLTADRLHQQGDATIWYQDADLAIIYRRGAFQATNALPTVTLQLSADQVPAQGSVTLTATATDSDGAIARVEFYDGSTRLGQSEAAPYPFVWGNVPAGNHLLSARAIDNLGGSKDSSPRLLSTGGGNALPTVTLQLSADQVSAQGSVTLTATATDSDGTIARVEFYDGSTKLSQSEAAPYSFVWQNIPAGNHLLSARAIDNLGGSKESSPRLLTASGTPLPSGDKPKLSATAIAKDTVRLTVSGTPGYYIIAMSEDLQNWVDIYPVTIDASGVGTIEDSGGPLNYSRLFYRVRRD